MIFTGEGAASSSISMARCRLDCLGSNTVRYGTVRLKLRLMIDWIGNPEHVGCSTYGYGLLVHAEMDSFLRVMMLQVGIPLGTLFFTRFDAFAWCPFSREVHVRYMPCHATHLGLGAGTISLVAPETCLCVRTPSGLRVRTNRQLRTGQKNVHTGRMKRYCSRYVTRHVPCSGF